MKDKSRHKRNASAAFLGNGWGSAGILLTLNHEYGITENIQLQMEKEKLLLEYH